ncbi:MAG: hypothetical protein JO061_18460, partial [Acidobacteriaceae bacterium]|nr:hypothetical protein [Acidobacteriaceae bacterium]
MPLLDSHTREAQRRDLLERLKPRLAVEEYFGRSGRTFRKSRFRLWFNRTIKTRLLKAAFKGLGLYQRGYRNALSPELRRVRLYLPDLPRALDGFEILHLSDLHIDRLDSLDEAVAGIVEGLRPDMCVLTGDYRWEINGTCSEVYPRMRTVLRSVRAR